MKLIITNLHKSFDEKKLFDGFSYEFSGSGVYALVGESGSGKTTLLRIIAGLDKDYTGEVTGGGIVSCSIAFQEHRLFPWLTALENVVFSVSDGKDKAVFDRAIKTLSDLGIEKNDMGLLPDALSGGMKQRISLARAFISDAPILLLDEPTKELDEANAALVRERILAEGKKRLVIIATHSAEDIATLEAKVIKF